MAQVHGEVESEAALVVSNFTAGGFRSETQKDSQTMGALGIRPLFPSFWFSPFRKAMAEGPQHGWWRPCSCRVRGDWDRSLQWNPLKEFFYMLSPRPVPRANPRKALGTVPGRPCQLLLLLL